MYLRVKRYLDVIGAVTGIVLFAPFIVIVAALIRIFIGRSILFVQERPGLNGRLFACVKFRTMTNKCGADNKLLCDRERMTQLGTFLRRISIDELPQLWNIMRGDLSFIGPRPLLKEYLPYYTLEEQRRHAVRPGLTGWAQIHGRNNLPFDERLKMDVWYVDHLSWQLDLRILLATIRLVFTGTGTDLVSYPPLHEQRKLELNLLSLQAGHESNHVQAMPGSQIN
jgi:sugar transferase EpsL